MTLIARTVCFAMVQVLITAYAPKPQLRRIQYQRVVAIVHVLMAIIAVAVILPFVLCMPVVPTILLLVLVDALLIPNAHSAFIALALALVLMHQLPPTLSQPLVVTTLIVLMDIIAKVV